MTMMTSYQIRNAIHQRSPNEVLVRTASGAWYVHSVALGVFLARNAPPLPPPQSTAGTTMSADVTNDGDVPHLILKLTNGADWSDEGAITSYDPYPKMRTAAAHRRPANVASGEGLMTIRHIQAHDTKAPFTIVETAQGTIALPGMVGDAEAAERAEAHFLGVPPKAKQP